MKIIYHVIFRGIGATAKVGQEYHQIKGNIPEIRSRMVVVGKNIWWLEGNQKSGTYGKGAVERQEWGCFQYPVS